VKLSTRAEAAVMWVRLLAAVGLAVGCGAAAADEKPFDRTELDKRVAKAAHDAVAFGTDLFNKGNHEGCFRLYQGTLATLHPLLDHRPKLAAVVRDRLDKARDAKPQEGAFVLREALDAVQKETAEALLPPKKAALWDRLGGEKAVRAVVKDFTAAAVADPKVNFTRNGRYKLDEKGTEKFEQLVVEMVSEVSGGPLKYTGRDMKTTHKGMTITDAEFAATTGHLVATLKKFKVPQPEIDELVKIVESTKPLIVGQ